MGAGSFTGHDVTNDIKVAQAMHADVQGDDGYLFLAHRQPRI
jgi:hypothetical protein